MAEETFDRVEGMDIIQLLPEDIVIDEEINVRPWEGDGKKEQERIEQLAKTIEEEGQLQPGVAREVKVDGGVEYHLIAGHRRRNAIALINAGKTANEPPRKMNVVVLRNINNERAYRKAVVENIQRKNFSPMDLALNIVKIRHDQGWDARKDWSKLVADYLGVSRAQVTQHEKLLSLPKAQQQEIHENGWSAMAAQTLAGDVVPEKRGAVIEKAKEKAKQDKGRGKGKGAAGVSTTTAKDGKSAAANDKEEAEERGANIKAKHVIAAAREVDGALSKPKSRAKSEIIEFFDALDGPAYGHENAPVRQFVQYFRDKWVPGIGTDTTLMKKFDGMVLNAKNVPYAGEGTPSKDVKEPEPVEKGKGKGKGTTKPKAKAKAKGATATSGKK